MSKLEELIARLCPDGVEYKKLCDCVKSISNINWNKAEGQYRYIDLSSVDRDKHCILETQVVNADNAPSRAKQIILKDDVLVGTTRPLLKRYCIIPDDYDNNICSTGFCVLRAEKSIVLPRWIYHNVSSNDFFAHVELFQKGASYPAISDKELKEYKLPVPPLEVQREIVHILDSFTFLTAELAAELAARQKQYEFYRDELLNTDENRIELKQVVKKASSGSTPNKKNIEYYEGGMIPWIRTQDVKFNEITAVDSFITEKAVQETSAKWIPENCVIVAISGATAGRCAINKIKATTNQHCLNMIVDESKALYKYVFYCVANQYEELVARKQGARGDLNSSLILSLKIPVPPLSEQQRIVDILDRFDALCNDITSGLPAEIEARRKQYEYYRDKLLTFKELKKEA